MTLKAQAYSMDKGFENYSVIQKKTLNFFDAVKNSNKFYTIELHSGNNIFRVFTDYGRLGVTSKKEVRETTSLSVAENEFDRIFREKTKKGYKEIELAQSTTGSAKAKELIDTKHIIASPSKQKSTTVKSNLCPDVQFFVRQIFEETERKLNYFVKGTANSDGASPLGKLSKSQLDKGRNLLQEISDIILMKKNIQIFDVLSISNEYYANIPKAFGHKVTPEMIAIRTIEAINEQMDILRFYEDSLRMGNVIFDSSNLDKQYESLKTDISVISKRSDVYDRIVHMVNSTESRHHNTHLAVQRIFEIKQKNAPAFIDKVGNVKPLFHGTRSANLPGILSTNLKLPTQLKGVHITGAMFGPGLYFADQSTKSSQYSCSKFGGTVNKSDSAFMFVADVALGRIKEVTRANYFLEPPKGYDSVKGVEGPSLLHNEYIVYRENQHELRYIVEFIPKRKR